MPTYKVAVTRNFCSDETVLVEADSEYQARHIVEGWRDDEYDYEPELTEQTPDVHDVVEVTE
jgi:hypothetical protein